MRRFVTAAAAVVLLLAASSGSRADVILENKLSGTGDNVVFESITGNLAIGSFNGQHQGFAFFRDLSGSSTFTGAQNGNDIKIANTSNLDISMFGDTLGTQQLFTQTDVFSLKGTGTVTAFVTAVDQFGNVEPVFTFNLGLIDPNAQSGFTFSAINGELIKDIRLLDVGGSIADFEHYRIDIGTLNAVPGPIAGAGLPGLLGAMSFGMVWLSRRRRQHSLGV